VVDVEIVVLIEVVIVVDIVVTGVVIEIDR